MSMAAEDSQQQNAYPREIEMETEAETEGKKGGSKWDQLPATLGKLGRKEKRKAMKKLKRKVIRKEAAEKEREEEAARLNDPVEQLKIQEKQKAEAEAVEKARQEFEERERIWLQNYQRALEEEEAQRKRQQELDTELAQEALGKEEEENWEYIEEGPAEIIWQGNEIIVQKKKIRLPKGKRDMNLSSQDSNLSISNPLPPQNAAFEAYKKLEYSTTGLRVFDEVEQQIPNFGTEQDKAHCPFHIKTGACRFGNRCSRAHFYPDKSCTLLMKNMYNGPGLTWEQEEGLEYTDEEMTQHYDEFYDDVHTEFLKFGELINFKVCKNGSSHLRGNVYVHYQSLDSAVAAFNAINGRFFAGKQVVCEFVAITRWKMAICGEYMKSRHKSCSHGNACNFLHCFRNPGGEYDWGDWDSPPPRSWLIKMDMLFGGSRVDRHDYRKPREQDNWHHYGHFDRRIQSRSSCKSSSRRHKSRERDSWSSDDSGGTSIRDHSGSSKYNSEEEREKRSYLDQPWDTYNMRPNQRNCSHSRGGSEKPKRGDKDICEDRKNMDRHYHINDSSLYRIKRKRRQREHTSEDDNDDKERSAVGVDKDHAGEKQSKRRRESCIQSEGEDNKSNDRETIEGEDFGSSHHEKERKGRASRRPQDQLDSANIDREKIKSSKRGHRRSQSPRKHKDHRKGPKRHRYSKSPRRSINLSRRRDRGKSVSPNRGQYSNRLPSRSRDLCETPKRSSAEGSFDSLDRWQASNDTEL